MTESVAKTRVGAQRASDAKTGVFGGGERKKLKNDVVSVLWSLRSTRLPRMSTQQIYVNAEIYTTFLCLEGVRQILSPRFGPLYDRSQDGCLLQVVAISKTVYNIHQNRLRMYQFLRDRWSFVERYPNKKMRCNTLALMDM
jgi:hypothetical protein